MKKYRLSLDYDLKSRGYDEIIETDDLNGAIIDYVHHNGDMVAELAGVDDLSQVDNPRQYVDITENQKVS